jgi:large subunit ribosomal protein L11
MNTGPAYKASVRLYVNAGVAKPSPKIGQALGPLGINMMQFCKEFNDRTGQYNGEVPMRVILQAYVDRSFKFVVKPPPTSWFVKKAAGQMKGSDKPGQNVGGRIGIKYIYEIAKVKQEVDPHLKQHDVEGICRMVLGTVRSMGYQVVEDTLPPEPLKIEV